MSAGLAVRARVDARDVEVDLEVEPGSRVAVVGPNGAGKSTLVQVLAGLTRPDSGEVRIGGRLVDGGRVHVPSHARGLALLSQRSLLFPHLSVAENGAFGPRARGVARREALATAQRHLDAVGCGELAQRRPGQLSGGQQQRVALARALAGEPEAVLLDEPLAALDVGVAPEMRRLLRERLAGQTVLLVTHDLLDVLALAEEVVVVEGGRIVERGPVGDVLARPRTEFLARLVGLNLLTGVGLDADRLDLGAGLVLTGIAEDGASLARGWPALATVEPAAVSIHLAAPGGSPRTVLPATVVALEPRGAIVRVTSLLPGGQSVRGDVTAASTVELDLRPGAEVLLGIKATQVRLYPR